MMRKIISVFMFMLFFSVGCGNPMVPTQQLEIIDVYPVEGFPGRMIKMEVIGNIDLNEQIRVVLGPVIFESEEVITEDGKITIWFEISNLDPGSYSIGIFYKGESFFWNVLFLIKEATQEDQKDDFLL